MITVPFKPKVRVQLFKCGTPGCGKSYSNPLTHVCKIRMDKPKRTRKKK